VSSYTQLIGEGAEETIITCPDDVIFIGGGRQTLIQGFSIRSESRYSHCIEVGIYSGEWIIKDNILSDSDRGISGWYGPEDFTICNNKIVNNRSEGITMSWADGIICNNLIIGNGEEGIVIGDWSDVLIKNNIITDNNEGGIYLGLALDAAVENNIIRENGKNGIKSYNCGGGSLKILNNIISENKGYGLNSISEPHILIIDYNDIWKNTLGDYEGVAQPGPNDICVDPLFVRSDVNHYSLKINSPCIDTGDPTILDPDQTRSNMGAYGGPEAKIVNITLIPGETTVMPRTELKYTQLLSNNFATTYDVINESEFISSKGISYPGLGPTNLTLSPYQTLEQELVYKLPSKAGQGDYIYLEKVSQEQDEKVLIDEDSFDVRLRYMPVLMKMQVE
jgi:parallel beta-helix repeat protein